MTPDNEPKKNFLWIPFYTEFANKLRQFKSDRSELIEFIHDDQKQSDHFNYLRDRDSNNYKCDLEDICPFTTIGMFNRGITDLNRRTIAKRLASFLKIDNQVPSSFSGIPTLNNQLSWFFGFANNRQPDDIDNLWKIFDEAIEYADDQNNMDGFTAAFDAALRVRNTGPRYLSIGLFWIRPASFLPLDQKSEKYILDNADGLSIGKNLSAKLNAEQYLNIVKELKARFNEQDFSFSSFPELALRAVDSNSQPARSSTNNINSGKTMMTTNKYPLNQILYGPPGTGKTYNAISLAVAIAMGQEQDWQSWKSQEKEEERLEKFNALMQSGQIQMVTFHQNYAYEDFIEGIKPVLDKSEAKDRLSYELKDGIFKRIANAARSNPAQNYVLLIDEINRGNIAKIFGELITLIEESKRLGEKEGMTLTLPYSKEEFGVPNNLYIIGTMNTADRSIALLDTALRRRFKFTEIMPNPDLLKDIEGISLSQLLKAINERITALHDREHQIGHSYLMGVESIEGLKATFQQNIIPLLQEYFFDDWDRIVKVLNNNGFITQDDTEHGIIYSVLSHDDKKWDDPSSYIAIYERRDDSEDQDD